jgi:fructosamine-3-kinase
MTSADPAGAFTKRRPGAPGGFFAVEAAGLRWLRVDGGAEVAEVIDVTADSITLVRVDEAPPTPQAAAELGRRLACTHDAGAAAFGIGPDGWSGDGFIGNAALSLRPHATWGEFYASERVLPYARTAHATGALGTSGLTAITALADRLGAGEFDDSAPPARIHGDLWAGNVIFTGTSATLIDPATHGGHRITDLAMLALFGLPYLEEVFAGYAEASAHLPHRWRELIGLHQLHPLLVHAVLFGSGYGEQAVRVARRY